jgi:hypothetical protein
VTSTRSRPLIRSPSLHCGLTSGGGRQRCPHCSTGGGQSMWQDKGRREGSCAMPGAQFPIPSSVPDSAECDNRCRTPHPDPVVRS